MFLIDAHHLTSAGTTFFKLPSGELNPGEGEVEGMIRIVNNTLGRDDGVITEWSVEEVNYFNPQYDCVDVYVHVPSTFIPLFLSLPPPLGCC